MSWYKAYYHIDKKVNVEDTHTIVVNQVLSKVETKSLPRWRPRIRYWDVEFVGSIEIPGTIFCTEKELIKKRKFIRGDKPEVVHSRDVAHTNRDRTGCSILRRHQLHVGHTILVQKTKKVIKSGLV